MRTVNLHFLLLSILLVISCCCLLNVILCDECPTSITRDFLIGKNFTTTMNGFKYSTNPSNFNQMHMFFSEQYAHVQVVDFNYEGNTRDLVIEFSVSYTIFDESIRLGSASLTPCYEYFGKLFEQSERYPTTFCDEFVEKKDWFVTEDMQHKFYVKFSETKTLSRFKLGNFEMMIETIEGPLCNGSQSLVIGEFEIFSNYSLINSNVKSCVNSNDKCNLCNDQKLKNILFGKLNRNSACTEFSVSNAQNFTVNGQSPSPFNPKKDDSSDIGIIVGATIGGLFVIICFSASIIGLLYMFYQEEMSLISTIHTKSEITIQHLALQIEEPLKLARNDGIIVFKSKYIGTDVNLNGHYVVKIINNGDYDHDYHDSNNVGGDDDGGEENANDLSIYNYGEIEHNMKAKQMHNANILTYEITEKNGNEAIIISKYRGINLSNYRNLKTKLYLGNLLQILIKTSHGLKSLHDNNLIHCDIKPDNLFLQETIITKKEDNILHIETIIGDLGSVRENACPIPSDRIGVTVTK
ncbi:predicted protein, partial [Naegleria gruberi]